MVPLLHFRHYATFCEREKNQKFQVFFLKSLLRFLSLRYSADFRRSRLVYYWITDYPVKMDGDPQTIPLGKVNWHSF